MGHCILLWLVKLPIQMVANDNLSSTTIKVRRSLLGVNDSHVRSFSHLLQHEKDKTTINYGATFNEETDIIVTSFAAQKLYGASFGDTLGIPVSVFLYNMVHKTYFRTLKGFIRRPDLPDGHNLYYIMPATIEGDLHLVAGLSKNEFDSLAKDKKWKEYAEFIG